MGSPPKAYDVVIDTGSSNFNLAGCDSLCPGCHIVASRHCYRGSKTSKQGRRKYTMRYIIGQGLLQEYEDVVRPSPYHLSFNYKFSVFIRGKKVGNIWGLGYKHHALPFGQPLTPLFDVIQSQYSLKNQFGLLFCADKGKSQLILGKLPFKVDMKKVVFLKSNKSYNYSAKIEGINSEGQRLISFDKVFTAYAIFDSGTTGQIILNKDKHHALVQFLKKKLGRKARRYDRIFWQGRGCIEKRFINFTDFPALTFVFGGGGSKQRSFKLPSKYYINQGGCGRGRLHFGFVPMDLKQYFISIKLGEADKLISTPVMIIGTPFLEKYFTVYQRASRYTSGRIAIYPNDDLCHF